MAGELGFATTVEIACHAHAAVNAGVDTLHFYAYDTNVKENVWSAVAKV